MSCTWAIPETMKVGDTSVLPTLAVLVCKDLLLLEHLLTSRANRREKLHTVLPLHEGQLLQPHGVSSREKTSNT